jgi:hypothetical protein
MNSNEYKIKSAGNLRTEFSEGCTNHPAATVAFNRIADFLTCSYTHTANSRAVIL